MVLALRLGGKGSWSGITQNTLELHRKKRGVEWYNVFQVEHDCVQNGSQCLDTAHRTFEIRLTIYVSVFKNTAHCLP